MPVPPVPPLDTSITPGQLGHIADHEAIHAALDNDTASLSATQTITGPTTFDDMVAVNKIVYITATGDGSDVTASLQAQISALAAGDYAIVTPPVTAYGITSTLTLPAGLADDEVVTIEWAGVKILSTVASAPTIQSHEGVVNLGRLVIDCQDTAGSIGVRFGGTGVACRNSHFEHLVVVNAKDAEVEFKSTSGFGCYYNTIGRLHARYGDGVGVRFKSAGATNETNSNYIYFASIQNHGGNAITVDGGDGNAFGFVEAESNTGYAIDLVDAVGFWVSSGWFEGNGPAGVEFRIADYPTVKGVIFIRGQSDGTLTGSMSHTYSGDRTVIIERGNDKGYSLGMYGFAALDVGLNGVAATDQDIATARLRVASQMLGYRRSSSEKTFTTQLAGGTAVSDNSGYRILDEAGNQVFKATHASGLQTSANRAVLNDVVATGSNADVRLIPTGTGLVQALTGGFRQGASGPTWTTGSGSPEGVVAAPQGSIYSDTGGELYIKNIDGGANTGWKLVTHA